jgi:hypothetical protein
VESTRSRLRISTLFNSRFIDLHKALSSSFLSLEHQLIRRQLALLVAVCGLLYCFSGILKVPPTVRNGPVTRAKIVERHR